MPAGRLLAGLVLFAVLVGWGLTAVEQGRREVMADLELPGWFGVDLSAGRQTGGVHLCLKLTLFGRVYLVQACQALPAPPVGERR